MESELAQSTHRGLARSQWRVVILSSLGGALEFYDFVIYSLFAQYIGAAFFPAKDPLTSLLLSFSVFAVGYLVRPLGGLVLSHFGDKYGRRKVFIFSILSMSVATAAIGVLPTHATIGVTASILMVCFRLLQGFSLGGELPGAITFVVETVPTAAGFASGFIFFCVNSGVILASALSLVIHETLTEPEVAQWGWRLGFLFGGAAGLISFWLRLSLEETGEFAQLRRVASRQPFIDLMRTHAAPVLTGIAALAASAGFNGLLFAMPAFLPRVLGYPPVEALRAENICLIVVSFGLIGTAWLGDRIPRRYILGTGALLLLAFAVPFFTGVANRGSNLILLFTGAGLAASLCHGTMSGVVADLFPTRLRFSGVALSYNLAFSIFSGLAPLAATLLVVRTGSPIGPAYFMCACAFMTLASTLFLHRYDGRILREQEGDRRAQLR
jgi:MFS transporter, MHS family, proline/betaine transporter